MDELIYRILKEIENGTENTSTKDLNVDNDKRIKAFEEIESRKLVPKDCFAHAKNKPIILMNHSKITSQGAQFLRNFEKTI